MSASTSHLQAAWVLDVGSAGTEKIATELPRPHGSVTVEVANGNYADLARGLSSVQEQVNANLTKWKEALGNEEASDDRKRNVEGLEDADDDEEVEASDDDEDTTM